MGELEPTIIYIFELADKNQERVLVIELVLYNIIRGKLAFKQLLFSRILICLTFYNVNGIDIKKKKNCRK